MNKLTSFFEKNGYVVCKNIIADETVKLLASQFDLFEGSVSKKYKRPYEHYFGDSDVDNCFGCYSPNCFEGLLLLMKEKMEKITGLELLPTYSYGRIYYKDADLKKQTDRPTCEISATIVIQNDEKPWEIFLKNLNDEIVTVSLDNGDALIYKGCELEHWRDNYEGNKQIQAFLHYVNSNGEYKDEYCDGRNIFSQVAKVNISKNYRLNTGFLVDELHF
jgi:hypothetical protein